MYCLAQVCRICIKRDGQLIKIHDLDIDNITFYKKLTLCLPNMIFEETSMKIYLCQNCSNILRKMYDFRELCISSERILNTYVLQLKQASSFKNSEQSNLKELMDNNYKILTAIRIERPASSEPKVDSAIDKEVIKTETPDFEYVDVPRFDSNSLLNIKKEPIEIVPDCQEYIVNVDRTDNNINANKDSSIQSPNTSETLRSKPRIKNIEKRYKCDICSEGFNYPGRLQRHREVHAGIKPYECDVCSKCFSDACSLYKHKGIHSDDKQYVCDICSKSFNRSDILLAHKRIHTGERPYKCDVCCKSFNQSGNLQLHKRIHTGEKPHVCDICNKSFNHPGSLNKHKRIHTGEKPYKCDVCHKSFNQSGYLHLHKRIHTGEKPYECDVCNKSFNQSGNLYLHKRIHTGENSYECDVCSKSFNHLSSLQRHKRIHIDEKPYECDVCNKGFKDASNLRVHKQIHVNEQS